MKALAKHFGKRVPAAVEWLMENGVFVAVMRGKSAEHGDGGWSGSAPHYRTPCKTPKDVNRFFKRHGRAARLMIVPGSAGLVALDIDGETRVRADSFAEEHPPHAHVNMKQGGRTGHLLYAHPHGAGPVPRMDHRVSNSNKMSRDGMPAGLVCDRRGDQGYCAVHTGKDLLAWATAAFDLSQGEKPRLPPDWMIGPDDYRHGETDSGSFMREFAFMDQDPFDVAGAPLTRPQQRAVISFMDECARETEESTSGGRLFQLARRFAELVKFWGLFGGDPGAAWEWWTARVEESGSSNDNALLDQIGRGLNWGFEREAPSRPPRGQARQVETMPALRQPNPPRRRAPAATPPKKKRTPAPRPKKAAPVVEPVESPPEVKAKPLPDKSADGLVFIDFETTIPQRPSLEEHGLDRYLDAARPYLLAVAVGDGPVRLVEWDPREEPPVDDELAKLAGNPDVRFAAHNAQFEFEVWTRRIVPAGYPAVEPQRWTCTAAMCAAAGWPRGLDNASMAVLGAPGKVKAGKEAMLRVGREWARSTDDAGLALVSHRPSDLDALRRYAKADVDVCRALYLSVSDLPDVEQRAWLADLTVNRIGWPVDEKAAQDAVREYNRRQAELDAECAKLTKNRIVRFRSSSLGDWCRRQGAKLPKTTKGRSMSQRAISTALYHGGASPAATRLLELRRDNGTADAKAVSILNHVGQGGRLRHSFVYFGAYTGRWTSEGAQVHNMSRTGKIRKCFRAPDGMVFVVADLSQIEARTTALLAGEADMLEAFASGNAMIYERTAAALFGVDVSDVDSEQRQIGKAVTLGKGYGLGKAKLGEYLAGWGLHEQAKDQKFLKRANSAFDKARPKVAKARNAMEAAFKSAIGRPDKWFKAGLTRWTASNGHVFCEMPSGRFMAYRNAKLDGLALSFDRPAGGRTRTWGSKLFANVSSGIARDVHAEALVQCVEAGLPVCGHVHDELVACCPEKEADAVATAMVKHMTAPVDWAPGLPVQADAQQMDRYGK